uniref:Uncharacterized protein n=1 Tax=Peromyscus maniculatus bairdii TaxID=230844 RepID=A0A8C8UHC3_PERMB
MAKFISGASTGCSRRKARGGARGNRAGGCVRAREGHGGLAGTRWPPRRALSSSERATDLHARPGHTAAAAAAAARSRAALPRTSPRARPPTPPRPLPARLPGRITGELPGRSRSEAPLGENPPTSMLPLK